MTMQVIQHQELSSAQPNITFSSIPQTPFTDLLLVTSLRDTSGTNGWTNALIQFNGLSTNLTSRVLFGWAGSSNTGSFSDTYIYHEAVGGGSTANTFANSSIYIPNYTGSTSKSLSVDTSTENNGNAINAIVAGLWNATAAITSIAIIGQSGNLAQFSSATLYGITKGSDGVTSVS
jgi:hypothetical protein